MGDQILRQIVGLLVGVWLARYLGPQLFGEFSYAFAVVMIVSPIAMLALDGIVIRSMVQDSLLQGRSPRHLIHFDDWRRDCLPSDLAMASIFWARPDGLLVHWLVGIHGRRHHCPGIYCH